MDRKSGSNRFMETSIDVRKPAQFNSAWRVGSAPACNTVHPKAPLSSKSLAIRRNRSRRCPEYFQTFERSQGPRLSQVGGEVLVMSKPQLVERGFFTNHGAETTPGWPADLGARRRFGREV